MSSAAIEARSPDRATTPHGARQVGLLAVIALAQLITSLDYNIVYVALPRIGESLGFSSHTLQWVVSAYAVSFGGLLLLGGRVADLFSRRQVLVAGLACYAIASAAGGMATTPAMLIGGRVGQGVGGALLFPATLALINSAFVEPRTRQLAFSVWGAAGAVGMVLGSLAGGLLTDSLGWPSVFLVNVPLAIVGIVGAIRYVEATSPPKDRSRFDAAGALTGTAAVTLLVLSLVQGPEGGWSRTDLLTIVVALSLGAAFVVIERRSVSPLVPLRLLRHANLRIGMAVTFLFMATIGSSLYFLTLYFQSVHGYSPLRAGVAFLIPMIATCIGSAFAGLAATKVGTHMALGGGLLVAAIGCFATAVAMSGSASYSQIVPGLVLYGFGQGVAYPLMFALAGSGVPSGDQGVASGLASTTQQIGGAVGLAVLVAASGAGDAIGDLTGDVRTALFLISAGVLVTAVLVTATRAGRLRPGARPDRF